MRTLNDFSAESAVVDPSESRFLMTRVPARDPDSTEAVFERYAGQLARLAEKHLSRRIAQRVEGEDVVQSVFQTFFQRAERGEFKIHSQQELCRICLGRCST